MNKYQESIKWLEEIFVLMGGEFVGDHRKSLQELVDKATPMEVVRNTYNECPNCSEHFTDANDYCQYCGQALDWSKDE